MYRLTLHGIEVVCHTPEEALDFVEVATSRASAMVARGGKSGSSHCLGLMQDATTVHRLPVSEWKAIPEGTKGVTVTLTKGKGQGQRTYHSTVTGKETSFPLLDTMPAEDLAAKYKKKRKMPINELPLVKSCNWPTVKKIAKRLGRTDLKQLRMDLFQRKCLRADELKNPLLR